MLFFILIIIKKKKKKKKRDNFCARKFIYKNVPGKLLAVSDVESIS